MDAQAVAARKLVVALVVRGHGHDGAGAVTHQHEVGDPDRHALAGQRVDRVDAERHAALFHRLEHGFGDARALAFGDEFLQVGIVLRGALRERMFGRDRHVRDAEQRVGPRRVDTERAAALDVELDFEAFRAADPVGLHRLCTRSGQSGSVSRRAEQFVGITR